MSTSTFVPGDCRRICRIVSAQTSAPPSASSSRLTLVITTCPSCIVRDRYRRRARGSSRSSVGGRPVAIWQNPQLRVQTSPRIISVAVPAAQHSPMFGHLALWQTVCRRLLVDEIQEPANTPRRRAFSFSARRVYALPGRAPGMLRFGSDARVIQPCCWLDLMECARRWQMGINRPGGAIGRRRRAGLAIAIHVVMLCAISCDFRTNFCSLLPPSCLLLDNSRADPAGAGAHAADGVEQLECVSSGDHRRHHPRKRMRWSRAA